MRVVVVVVVVVVSGGGRSSGSQSGRCSRCDSDGGGGGGSGCLSLDGHVRPVEGPAAQQHVTDERLDGRLAHQAHEEELLDHLRRHGAEGGQAQQELAEAGGLVGVLAAYVLLQGALRLLLDALDVGHVRQTAGVCKDKRTQHGNQSVTGFHKHSKYNHKQGHTNTA